MVVKVKNLARIYANEHRMRYRDDEEMVLHDFNFERVEKLFGQFKRSVPKDLLEDCYQEIWVACLDRKVTDIEKNLKYWKNNERHWLEPHMYSLEEECGHIADRAEENEEMPDVGDIIYDLGEERLKLVRKLRYSRSQSNIALCVGILLQRRRCRITPYHVAVAREEKNYGVCPWCAACNMDFGDNREIGLCHRCNFAFCIVEDD